jgi:hypothetical protein
MKNPNTAKRITLTVKIRIDVKPGIEPVGVLDLALDKVHNALDGYESRNRDEVTDVRMTGDIRDANIELIEE